MLAYPVRTSMRMAGKRCFKEAMSGSDELPRLNSDLIRRGQNDVMHFGQRDFNTFCMLSLEPPCVAWRDI